MLEKDWGQLGCEGTSERSFVFPAGTREIFEHSAKDVHLIVDVNEIHGWKDQQYSAQRGAVVHGAGQTGYG